MTRGVGISWKVFVVYSFGQLAQLKKKVERYFCGPLGLPVDTIIQNTVDDYAPPPLPVQPTGMIEKKVELFVCGPFAPSPRHSVGSRL